MHVGKLMARLNPRNVRFDVGSGGIPELTSTDIAACLGMIPAGLGRELLCRVWWPDGAALTAGELASLLDGVLFAEWRARADALVTAQIMHATAQAGTLRMRNAVSALESAKSKAWPTICDTYTKLRNAVVAEISDPKLCPACDGRGETAVGSLLRTCSKCDGSGTSSRGPTWRADALGMTHQSYRARWSDPYDWLLGFCCDKLAAAQSLMMKIAS